MNGSVTILLYLLCLVAEMNGNDAFDDAFEDERESESFLSQRTPAAMTSAGMPASDRLA